MERIRLVLAVLLVAGCSGPHSGTPVSPVPASPLTASRPTLWTPDSLIDRTDPTAPIDSALLAADFAAEGRLAADSAADEAVLEELATAHPEGDSTE
jgi:hypothetical protein